MTSKENFPPYRIVVFPSGDGAHLDFTALVPAALPSGEALRIANAAIRAANEEDDAAPSGGCAAGLCVEDSIKRRLGEQGFVFPDRTACNLTTIPWDRGYG